jgi:4-carboxymuconolactone decarboxylase
VTDDATWSRAIHRFGDKATVDLVGIVGYYSFLAMVMNAARTPLPGNLDDSSPLLQNGHAST